MLKFIIYELTFEKIFNLIVIWTKQLQIKIVKVICYENSKITLYLLLWSKEYECLLKVLLFREYFNKEGDKSV